MPETPIPSKPWYTSKTLWVNFIAIVTGFVADKFGYVVSAEMALTVLGLINAFLRFITKSEIVW